MLCAPAVIAMLLVTGYPIVYAIYLSPLRFDLRFPDEQEFVGLSNYTEVLTSSTWWLDFSDTMIIMGLGRRSSSCSDWRCALIMHRAICGRGPVRASILIPYGIVTVVAAFAWRFAFDPTAGFIARRYPSRTEPMNEVD